MAPTICEIHVISFFTKFLKYAKLLGFYIDFYQFFIKIYSWLLGEFEFSNLSPFWKQLARNNKISFASIPLELKVGMKWKLSTYCRFGELIGWDLGSSWAKIFGMSSSAPKGPIKTFFKPFLGTLKCSIWPIVYNNIILSVRPLKFIFTILL